MLAKLAQGISGPVPHRQIIAGIDNKKFRCVDPNYLPVFILQLLTETVEL